MIWKQSTFTQAAILNFFKAQIAKKRKSESESEMEYIWIRYKPYLYFKYAYALHIKAIQSKMILLELFRLNYQNHTF